MIVASAKIESCFLAVVGLFLLLLPGGCANGGSGTELAVRPVPRALEGVDGETIRLPQDEPFSIALRPLREAPGLTGGADADAHVSRDGNADAFARVENGGSAQAVFQLGHAFQNDSDRQMELNVRLRCAYEVAAGATPPSPFPRAKVDLRLCARGRSNRLLRNLNLAHHSTEEGAAASTDQKDVRFMLILSPHESVSIFVAGTVTAETREEQSAEGSIELSGLEMEVQTKLAPPVRSADNEQG